MLQEFVEKYGGVYEHSPWVAERVYAVFDDASTSENCFDSDVLAALMADCVDNAAPQIQLELIRAHPDLAGGAQVAGELTADSTSEQASAGLDQCSADEYEQFQYLNTAYTEKFEFPFIMAVRESNRAEILASFRQRLKNNYADEFEAALREIHAIARMRLNAMEQAG